MQIKRSLALLLTFLLVFSSSVMAAAGPVPVKEERTKPVTSQENFSTEDEQKYKATDKVRVIVEVEGDPAIAYATKQGKKFSDLNKTKKTELLNNVLNSQEKVKKQFASKKVNMDFKENFTTVFNGFSGIVEYSQIANIEKLSGVTSITIATEYERPEATPEMKYSKELVEAQRAWDEYGYDGEGMIVGVIDTGVDPSHKDFVLTDDAKGNLTEGAVNSAINENGLSGQFHTAKVPYGYNYMDESQEILDLGPGASMHGMHVSGTVGANGDEDNGGIKGVSPEAQILGLKVFGNDPKMGSTWGDIYVKAIDDSIILGADVLNLSLGSTASFVSPEDPEQKAIERAVENGVLMSISAGNSAHLGNGFSNPVPTNPDIGVVGSPGLSYDSLQVASLENSFMDMSAVSYSFGDVEGLASFMSASSVNPKDLDEKTFGLEYAGLGGPGDFVGKDFTGKFALIQRGEFDFVTKTLNAQAAGASGVIVYNNADGYLSMASDSAIVIPQLFMLKTNGDLLATQIQDGVEVTISFDGETVTSGNPLSGEMSGFTSWGVTPNLDFKPEITAPGGNILSTFQDDRYGTMSGTSMAAPHVSGGSAIVLQRVDEEFGLEGKERVEMAKNIMMNTSKQVQDKGTVQDMLELDNPYSPRLQGAGLMQLHAALSTPVVVTEKNKGEAKVALKEVGENISFTLEATNYSDKAITYNVDANVQTDLALFGELGYAPNELEAQGIEGAVVTFNDGATTVEVPANGATTIEVNIDLAAAKVLAPNAGGLVDPEEIFPNGYFVEGFVTLSNETQPELSVPYVGFKGDWNAAPVLDELAYDGNDSFYEQAGMLTSSGDDFNYLGFDPLTGKKAVANIAISPNADGAHDNAIPILSFLRNAKLVEYSVLDKDKKPLRKIKSENNIRKNYFDGGSGGAQTYRLNSSVAWDGTVKNKVVEDGQYYYEISTTIDYAGKEAQKVQIPVVVDTVAPKVTAALDGNTVTFGVTDEGSGVAYAELLVNGKVVGTTNGEEHTHTFDKKLPSGAVVSVVAEDYAGNTDVVVIKGVNDKTPPVITPNTPSTGEIFNTNEIHVSGTVSDDSEIVEFKVMGEDVELVWNEEKGNYNYDTTVTFEEDGSHVIALYAKDVAGNEVLLSNSRFVIVDTTAPGLEVDVPSNVGYETTSVSLVAQLSDNFDELRYLVDGSEEYYNEMSGYDMVEISEEVTTELSLQPGNNIFKLEVIDVAGNTTTKEVSVYRAEADKVARISGDDRYTTALEISQDGWDSADTVILARGDNYADALAGVPLAHKLDAPILLTPSNKLLDDVVKEIKRLDAKQVIILGGANAVSNTVFTALENEKVSVSRASGDTRFETAAQIAALVSPDGAEEVVVVNGLDFPDALSVATHAAKQGLPILLTETNKLPQETANAIEALGATKSVVVGGTTVVTDKVAKQLPKATRLAGKDRYETNVKVANHFGVESKHVYVATGKTYADALTGAVLAAKNDSAVLLVHDRVPEVVKTYIAEQDVERLTIFGGESAVSTKVSTDLSKLVE